MLIKDSGKVVPEQLPEELLGPPTAPPDAAAPLLLPVPTEPVWSGVEVATDELTPRRRMPWAIALIVSVVALGGIGVVLFGVLDGEDGSTFSATVEGLGELEITGFEEVSSWEVQPGMRAYPGADDRTFVVVRATITKGQWDDPKQVMDWASDAVVRHRGGIAIGDRDEAFYIGVMSVADTQDARDVRWVFNIPEETLDGLDLDLGDGLVVDLAALPTSVG